MNKSKIATNLFFFLGALALGWMVYEIGPLSIWENVKRVGWWFLAVIALWAIVYTVNAVAFHIILRDGSPESKKISFLQTYKLTVSGYAINYLTPFGLMGGEPYKVIELNPILGIQKATSSVLLYAMMHFVSHFIFWMVSIPMLLFFVPVLSFTAKIFIAVAATGSLSLLYWSFTVYTRGFVSRALSLAGKLPFLGKKVKMYKEKHLEKITQMDALIADLYKTRKKDFVSSLGLELFSRFLLCFEVVFIMCGIGMPISFGKSVLIESIQSAFANLMFFMPMQLGAREGGFAIAYGILSLSTATGVFVSLALRIREIFWTLIGVGLIKVKSKV